MNDNSGSDSGRDYVEPQEQRNEVEEVEKLTQKESNRVFIWHKVVIAVMLATAVAVPVKSYDLLSRENKDDYETAFSLFSSSIRDSAKLNANGIVNAATTFSGSTSTYAKGMGATWPFVTVPSFEVQVINVKKATRAERILFLPIVEEEDYDEWNTYVEENIGWREESLQTLARGEIATTIGDGGAPVQPMSVVTIPANFTTSPANEVREAPHSPFWQSSPPQPLSVINLDTYSFGSNLKYARSIESTRQYIFGNMFDVTKTINNGLSHTEEEHDNLHAELTSSPPENARRDPGWASDSPHTTFVCPVFESEHDVQSKIVAKYFYILPWDAFLTNLLPEGSEDIMVVLNNSANQTASFIIRGNNAIFVGWEDKHDDKYDSVAVHVDFTGLAGIDAEDYTEVGEGGALLYDLVIYPTSDFENAYKNNIPSVFASAIAVAFLFMTMTFFTYDAIVHCRNKKVVRTAAKSNAIVTSLFPSTVRDRLFEEKDQEFGLKKSGEKSRLQLFLSGKGDVEYPGMESHEDELTPLQSQPIADHFEDCTVMFGDLVGFTSWSSTRDPAAVFFLLETIYNAFDKIAKRRGVFKVETIGDCYMAVCGLPDPRADHAAVMSRFALDCIRKLQLLTAQLENTLGPGTEKLTMRIGLHSGSVTAGVLRVVWVCGNLCCACTLLTFAKSAIHRDTARCESTGQPGRVHISSQTAQLLHAAGKGHWCEARETPVVAKGKGSMKTFWLLGTSVTSSMGTLENTRNDTSHAVDVAADTFEGEWTC